MIDIWYGNRQRFGHRGLCQRWINVLGRTDPGRTARLECSLNSGPPRPLAIGPDGHRLARPGDFNAEIDAADLREGENKLIVTAVDSDGRRQERAVTVIFAGEQTCPLPCRIEWSSARSIHEVAQVTDGKWALTPAGARVLEPYYDRVIGLGDRRWKDYEVATEVTFHSLRVPRAEQGDAGANVIHAALAVRWPGHDDDGRQPQVKWYPLGATAEFRVNPAWKKCGWRILGGGRICVEADRDRDIELERPYAMKHRVRGNPDGSARYSVKLWPAGDPEPEAWDLELDKDPGDVQNGGALLIAHYTEVTFGDVEVTPACGHSG
jgi:hypothetical protein